MARKLTETRYFATLYPCCMELHDPPHGEFKLYPVVKVLLCKRSPVIEPPSAIDPFSDFDGHFMIKP